MSSNSTKHYEIYVYIVLILLGIAVLMYVLVQKKAEQYKPTQIYFLTHDQTQHFLLHDSDGYGASLNKVNLHAAGVINYRDLIDKWSTAASEWKPFEIQKLKDAAQIADFHINTQLKDPFKSQMNHIEWQFAKTMHPYFCDGLPLTRSDIIFLTDKVVAQSSLKRLAKILIHEKSHIWSRKFPGEMQGWVERKGYKKLQRVSDDGLQRSNPDIDEWIYLHPKGNVAGVRYNSATPKDLFDVQFYDQKEDHPYEIFAQAVEKIIEN